MKLKHPEMEMHSGNCTVAERPGTSAYDYKYFSSKLNKHNTGLISTSE